MVVQKKPFGYIIITIIFVIIGRDDIFKAHIEEEND
jgi:hypothetical protein